MTLQRIREVKKAAQPHPATPKCAARTPPACLILRDTLFLPVKPPQKAVCLNVSVLPRLCATGPAAKMTIRFPAHLPPSSHSTNVYGTTVAPRHCWEWRFCMSHSPCVQGAGPQMPPLPENLSPSEAALNLLGCPPPPAAKLGCSTSARPTGQRAPWGQRLCLTPLMSPLPDVGPGIQ